MSVSPSSEAPRRCGPAELLRRARQGDQAALGALLAHHRARMRAVAALRVMVARRGELTTAS